MNKIVVKILPIVVLLNLHTFYAEYAERCVDRCPEQCTDVKIRGAAFIPQSKRFRKIYGTVGGAIEFEASTNLYRCIDGWANFNWLFYAKGHSIGLHRPTTIRIANFSFGLKFPWQFHDSFIAYIGAGPTFARVWLHNDSVTTPHRVSKTAFGGVFKSGLYCFITDNLFFDIFVDYVYQPADYRKQIIAGVVHKNHPNVGGVRPGIGFGGQF